MAQLHYQVYLVLVLNNSVQCHYVEVLAKKLQGVNLLQISCHPLTQGSRRVAPGLVHKKALTQGKKRR